MSLAKETAITCLRHLLELTTNLCVTNLSIEHDTCHIRGGQFAFN